jgi:ABC-type antimicrobial peptide transport system permease subunit
MKRKWLVIGGLVLAIVLLVVVTTLTKGSSPSACLQLLQYVEKNDATKSWKLFSTNAQAQLTFSDWSADVQSMNNLFGGATPKLQTRNSITSTGGASNKPNIEEIYIIDHNGSKFTATCTLIPTKSSYTVDTFANQSDN